MAKGLDLELLPCYEANKEGERILYRPLDNSLAVNLRRKGEKVIGFYYCPKIGTQALLFDRDEIIVRHQCLISYSML